MGFFSNFLGGIASSLPIVGDVFSQESRNDASNKEYERQKEFAQSGIRWRVQDAKAAGIHPIFAIGANTPTYSPQAAVGTDFGLSAVGQNIGRAIEAKQTRYERLRAENLQGRVAASQANYYNAAAANQLAQADLAGQRSVAEAMLPRSHNYVESGALLSERAQRTQSTQRQPAMPETWKHHVPKGDNMFQWMTGSRPDVYHFMPGNDYSQIFEDKGWILEKGGLASAAITYLGGRADNETLDGMKYFIEVGGWVPMESKLYRQLMEARHAKSRVNYGPERYRSIRDTPMRNWR